MEFKAFRKQMQKHFANMVKDEQALFRVELDSEELWNLYLNSFPAGKNEIYRTRREHDCSCCRHFMKSFGNVVAIKDNEIVTLWDFSTNDDTFQPVLEALSAYVRTKPVVNAYFSKETSVGTNYSKELDGDKIVNWEHFYLELPRFTNSMDPNAAMGEAKANRDVFKRSLEELTLESIETVLELIQQNSLYRGEEWNVNLKKFFDYKKKYDALATEDERNCFVWKCSMEAGPAIARIRNHSIGTLLIDISEDMDLDQAVRRYEAVVAPANYKRPKAIYTKKMLEDAKNTLAELGYMDSLARRYAVLDDITVNNILYCNRDSAKKISGADVFDEMAADVAVNPKKFGKVEEIAVDSFIANVLPTAKEVEVLLENRHIPNMVSLIAPVNADAKTMFKWNNNFSWAYSGNMTDSDIRENVKSAGGKIDGVLRFSIQWNDEEPNFNDFDAHCSTPNGEIYYASKYDGRTGSLDVDIIDPTPGIPAVENIVWLDKTRMTPGRYHFYVNNFNHKGGRSGFKAEIEFDGQIYSYVYNKEIRHKGNVKVATVTLKPNGSFSIVEHLDSTTSSRTVWNLPTNQFIPVSTIMYSPNYWDEQDGIGHRHVFFMLKDCINNESPNGMYNEFLKQDLMKHKRVLEALGSKMKVEDSDDQLSGIGFSTTKRNDVVVKVKGATERMLKIKF